MSCWRFQALYKIREPFTIYRKKNDSPPVHSLLSADLFTLVRFCITQTSLTLWKGYTPLHISSHPLLPSGDAIFDSSHFSLFSNLLHSYFSHSVFSVVDLSCQLNVISTSVAISYCGILQTFRVRSCVVEKWNLLGLFCDAFVGR